MLLASTVLSFGDIAAPTGGWTGALVSLQFVGLNSIAFVSTEMARRRTYVELLALCPPGTTLSDRRRWGRTITVSRTAPPSAPAAEPQDARCGAIG